MALPIPVEMTATVGQILTATEWNNNVRDGVNFAIATPVCVVTRSTTQAFTSGVTAAILFDTTLVDTYGGHTASDRYTAQIPGWYQVIGAISWANGTTGQRGVQIFKNGVGISYAQTLNSGGGAFSTVQAAGLIQLAATEIIQIVGFQSSGGALNSNAGGASLSVQWVHT